MCEECVSCVHGGAFEDRSEAALTRCGDLWKGGGPEIILTEPPLSPLTLALSILVIMAVLPQICLFGAGPKRKRWAGCEGQTINPALYRPADLRDCLKENYSISKPGLYIHIFGFINDLYLPKVLKLFQ